VTNPATRRAKTRMEEAFFIKNQILSRPKGIIGNLEDQDV
jgi:hypothetical protein